MTDPGGSFGTGTTSITSSWLLVYCTMSMRTCRAFVTEVGPVGTSLALQRNGCIGSPLICQTVRAIPRISPKCRAFRSPSRITGESDTWCSFVNSVSHSTNWVTCRTRIAVCARSSGLRARCVETTTSGALLPRHLSSTIKQLRSRRSRPLVSQLSTKSHAWEVSFQNFDFRQKTPQPSREASRGRLWKTESQFSPRECAKYSYWSSSTRETTSASYFLISLVKRTFRNSQLKCISSFSIALISCGCRKSSAYSGQPYLGTPFSSRWLNFRNICLRFSVSISAP
mmetsp:Transcript_152024/g.264953  ORF Transcript_152024/g.264953 Transcript_152024/m.264953 type:complete len:284 (-) Transcript_152024:678-1529(-)